MTTPQPIPSPTPQASLRALRAMIRERSVMPGLQVFHAETGDIFRINAPGFRPVMLVGAKASRFVLVEARDQFRWRLDTDSITDLLIHGVLVEDDESHDDIRRKLNPALHKKMLGGYVESMVARTDQVTQAWGDGEPVDMLVEMRKVALLILMDALFEVDYTPEMTRLWDSVLYLLNYISPGLWLFWRGVPRPGYRQARAQMDEYLFRIIAQRRQQIAGEGDQARTDMLSVLIYSGMDDNLIRDQLMTMLIAGHDTSTASLSWALYMLGQHPEVRHKAQAELDAVLGKTPPTPGTIQQLPYLSQVIDETLRLFPPIHLGSRVARADLEFEGYHIAKDTRVLYSIYLTQRDPAYWENPNTFDPSRFEVRREPYHFLPFGGGARNCIGAAFARVETKAVLARVLQTYDFEPLGKAHIHMGATLEPRPGVRVRVRRRG